MAKLRILLDSKGHFVGVLGFILKGKPPQKEIPIIFSQELVHRTN